MKKKIIATGVSILILAIAVGIFISLTKNEQAPAKSAESQVVLNVKTAVVQNEQYSESMAYSGRVNSYETVAVSAEVTGKIQHTAIPLKEGEAFSKGDVLISIYSKDNDASLKASKSDFMKTLASLLPDMSVDFENSYDKWNAFFNKIALDKPLPELPVIESEKERIYLAANSVLSEYYTIQQEEINAGKYIITAPFNGYYKTVSKTEGAIATAGTELATIIRSDKLEVTVPVVSTDSRNLKAGQAVTIRKDDVTLKGSISRIAGFVNASSQSVNVYVSINNATSARIFEGEYVTVDFQYPVEGKGVRVNREALLDDGSVYIIVDDNRLKKKSVQALHYSDDYVIVSGLDDKELLVNESLVNVEEGDKVAPVYATKKAE